MRTNRTPALIVGFLLGCLATPAWSGANLGQWSFLRGTPAELFNDEDWSIFRAAVNGTLNDEPVGATRKWENPNTRASGEITVLRALKQGGKDCKRVRMTNSIRNRSRTTTPMFCQQQSGEWRVTSPQRKAKTSR